MHGRYYGNWLVASAKRYTLNITVQQNEFSLRSEYEISTAGCIYTAQEKFLSWHDKITLMKPRGEVLARIKSRFPFLGSRYDFELSDGKVYRFWCEKLWKRVFACDGNNERYRHYEHKGLNYSVFQDDNQIAAFSKNRYKIGKGDQYEIRMNDDANFVIIVCLALTVDSSEYDDDTASFTVDVGNIGPEDRPFDESWEPN